MRLKTSGPEQLREWGKQIEALLGQKGAVPIGETSVLSRSLHTIEPARPGIINVLLGSDAGIVFYQRSRPGEILHLDIFHSLGHVDHRLVAERIKGMLEEEVLKSYLAGFPYLDYTDLQTGTGGGRLSGSLIYGRKETLRKAHTNHVHIATMLPPALWGSIVPLVSVVEEEIMRQGYQLRKVEGITCQRGKDKQAVDMSAYSSDSDSFLKGRKHEGRTEDYFPATKEEQLQAALELAEKVMNPRELKEIFAHFTPGQGRSPASYLEDQQGLLRKLQEEELVRAKGGKLYLTEKGQRLKGFLESHFAELEYHFRKLLRKLPLGVGAGSHMGIKKQGARAQGHWKRAFPLEEREVLGELAVPESLLAATKRWQLGAGKHSPALQRGDLHCLEPKRSQTLDVCLLIDASASMAGERLRSAKYLAQHLLLSTRDRVSVMVFQEREARLVVPFTRNVARVQQGLMEIKSYGLTPLSLGLQYALDYMERVKRGNRSLLFLITDGIPTVSRSSCDPAQDALSVAEEIARRALRFSCIGLVPNKVFLEELSRRGKGTFYIIDELQGKTLAQILHQERRRIQVR
ncbi:MAG: vWA domain-containing protein [bacterium]|jgi:magnesium chelatase subunit D